MAAKNVIDTATWKWLKLVDADRPVDWIDDAASDLGQALGVAHMFTSFIEEMKTEEQERAKGRQALGALQFIASVAKSVADLFEGAPEDVRERVRRADGVAAVLAQEAFGESFGGKNGEQYMLCQNDITESASYALVRALKEAKAAIDTWSEQVVREAEELKGRKVS